MTHGINTTIIEIDPVVYDFASKYFTLPPNHQILIDDAVTQASQLAEAGQTFDYVVHDVFTGGAEPVDLFTLEFLEDLRRLLKPNGVIAIVSPIYLLRPRALSNSPRTTPVISFYRQPA